MEWAITRDDRSNPEKSGVARFIGQRERSLRNGGTPIEGFQFLNSPLEMLRFSREIEEEILANPEGADLYVGFRNSEKLAGERHRYRKILEAGVRTSARVEAGDRGRLGAGDDGPRPLCAKTGCSRPAHPGGHRPARVRGV